MSPFPTSDLNHILTHASSDLRSLHGSRMLITGGTGYIGRWILETIIHANSTTNAKIQAIVLTRNPIRFALNHQHITRDPAITLIEGDIRTLPDIPGQFDYFFHAATDVISATSPLDMFDVTVHGTRQLLELARKNKSARVLLLSSGAVYGRNSAISAAIPETHTCDQDPTSLKAAYGLGKLATEWLGNAYYETHGLCCCSARIFAQVGPGLELNGQFAAGNFIRDSLLRQRITIKGDGTAVRSYMYATDLVAWLMALLVRGRPSVPYNVGSPHSITIRELAEMIARLAGLPSHYIHLQDLSCESPASDHYVPNTDRITSEHTVTITVPLDQALLQTLAWYTPLIQTRPQ